jgi:hypothetical protein
MRKYRRGGLVSPASGHEVAAQHRGGPATHGRDSRIADAAVELANTQTIAVAGTQRGLWRPLRTRTRILDCGSDPSITTSTPATAAGSLSLF